MTEELPPTSPPPEIIDQAAPAAPAPEPIEAVPAETRTDWGPPGPGRYLAALLVLLAFFAAAFAIVWILWGRQIWNTLTTSWT